MPFLTHATASALHSPALIRVALLALILPPLAITDRNELRIPFGYPVVIGLVGALIASFEPHAWWWTLASMVAGGAPLCASRLIALGGLGWGDVWLGAALGVLLGPRAAFAAIGAGAALALAASVCAGSGAGSEAPFAFGPYLIAGAILASIAIR